METDTLPISNDLRVFRTKMLELLRSSKANVSTINIKLQQITKEMNILKTDLINQEQINKDQTQYVR